MIELMVKVGVVKELKVKFGDKVAEGSVVLLLEADAAAATSVPNVPATPVQQAQAAPITVATAASGPAPAGASYAGTVDLAATRSHSVQLTWASKSSSTGTSPQVKQLHRYFFIGDDISCIGVN